MIAGRSIPGHPPARGFARRADKEQERGPHPHAHLQGSGVGAALGLSGAGLSSDDVELSGEVTTQVAFGDVGLPASEFSKIAEAVRKITEGFMADFPETEFFD
jgi:hypothetical protein